MGSSTRGTPRHPWSKPASPTLFPSMGYCILFVHGLRKLCTCLNRWGATTLTVCTALLLLLFSWKTVKQNEIWLSRESLFRYDSMEKSKSLPMYFIAYIFVSKQMR